MVWEAGVTLPYSLQLLVPTKLTAPQPRETWVLRGRLLAALDAQPQPRLTLVVAPAGCGKSTLVAQWLAQQAYNGRPGGPSPRLLDPAYPAPYSDAQEAQEASAAARGGTAVAWLTLDEHDQDALRVLAYIAGAITRVLPGALPTTLTTLAAPEAPPVYVVLHALLVDLSALPARLVLVLDDYHVVTTKATHQAITYLLRHLPHPCQLVLLCRADPPLPLARLRAENQLVELRAADLRFTEAETAAFLATRGAAADSALVAALQQQTEGWAIALQLAALSQADLRSPEAVRSKASRHIAEYLADEVLERQPVAIQQTLLVLSVPERFCAPLCAALLGTPEQQIQAETLLEELAHANLLLVTIDQEGRWHRFHHLFRDLLLRRLRLSEGEAGVRELQRRAAHWLATAGLAEEALRLFLAAGEEDAAAELVERVIVTDVGQGASNAMLGFWLRLLPLPLINRRPGLMLIAARVASQRLDIATFRQRMDQVDALLETPELARGVTPWDSFPGDRAALRGVLHCWEGRPAEALDELHLALAQGTGFIPASQLFLFMGLAHVGLGRFGADSAPGEPSTVEPPLGERSPHGYYAHNCTVALMVGSVDELVRQARFLLELIAAAGLGEPPASFANFCLGMAAYERSDLAAAAAHFAAIAKLKHQVNDTTYMSGIVGLVLATAAQGLFDEATAYAEEARQFAAESGSQFLRHQALGCLLELALARGNLGSALELAAQIEPDIHLGLSMWLETPRLSVARALIAAGDEARLAQADTLLAGCLAEVETMHHVRLVVATLALQALLRQAQQRQAEALVALERAVRLAASRGYTQTFVSLGPALQPLLRSLLERGVTAAYIQQLLAASGTSAPPPERHPLPLLREPLHEALTRREIEVLALLAERWSNQEIAERLFVTMNTVRKHTSTIYDKLGVSSRREAVAAAMALGLLTAS